MSDSRIPTALYFLMLTLGVLQCARVYPQLPDVMASHFGSNGVANGWESKPFFFVLSAIAVGSSAIVAFLAPRLIASFPNERINLPNKSYWLSAEHREEAMGFLRVQMIWFGCGLLFVLLYAMSQAITANLREVPEFDTANMWYVIGGFLIATMAWTIHLVWHFSKARQSDGSTR
jgi:uncharacterized membrane protein